VLGLDEYASAIGELCKCDELAFLADCQAKLEQRLGGVSETTRQGWLDYYDAECRASCQNALSCYDQPGTCATLACEVDTECCGGSLGTGSCVEGVCSP
jgi:hypothetical protein